MYQKLLADPQLSPFFEGTDMEKLAKHQARCLARRFPLPRPWCGSRRAGSAAAQGYLCLRIPGVSFCPGHSIEAPSAP